MELEPYFTPYIHIKPNFTIDLNVRPIKLPEKNTEANISDLEVGEVLLDDSECTNF